jgi:hypothetical protein
LTRYGASHRKPAAADLRTHNPISGKPEIQGRRPGYSSMMFDAAVYSLPPETTAFIDQLKKDRRL